MTRTFLRACAGPLCCNVFETCRPYRRYCCERCARSAANQRWYMRHVKTLLARRRRARREATPEQRARRAEYMRRWKEANKGRARR